MKWCDPGGGLDNYGRTVTANDGPTSGEGSSLKCVTLTRLRGECAFRVMNFEILNDGKRDGSACSPPTYPGRPVRVTAQTRVPHLYCTLFKAGIALAQRQTSTVTDMR